MSRQNVEAIQRVHDRWGREREIDPNDFHPDFEIRTPILQLGNRRHRGYEGYKAWRAANDEVTTDDLFETDEFVDLGDRVLVTGWLRLRWKSSGLETRERAVQLWTFNDSKPSSMTLSRTLEEALEAAGLRQ
jgi:hypothetical protein